MLVDALVGATPVLKGVNAMRSSFLVAAIAFFSVLIAACKHDDRRALDEYKNFVCDGQSSVVYSAWGSRGMSKSCVRDSDGRLNGSFIAAEYGRIFSISHYTDGKSSGLWLWYDRDGNITKELMHDEP